MIVSLQPLREKCSNTEFFSDPYFPLFGARVQENVYQKKTLYLDTFHAVNMSRAFNSIFSRQKNFQEFPPYSLATSPWLLTFLL